MPNLPILPAHSDRHRQAPCGIPMLGTAESYFGHHSYSHLVASLSVLVSVHAFSGTSGHEWKADGHHSVYRRGCSPYPFTSDFGFILCYHKNRCKAGFGLTVFNVRGSSLVAG